MRIPRFVLIITILETVELETISEYAFDIRCAGTYTRYLNLLSVKKIPCIQIRSNLNYVHLQFIKINFDKSVFFFVFFKCSFFCNKFGIHFFQVATRQQIYKFQKCPIFNTFKQKIYTLGKFVLFFNTFKTCKSSVNFKTVI